MNWDALGAIGELISAIAVVITLAYLAVQVRQSNKAAKSSNATSVMMNSQKIAQALMMDRGLRDIILRAIAGEVELSSSDKLAAYAWFHNVLNTGELAHMSFLHGELDQEYWEGWLSFYRSYYQTPGMQAYWAKRKSAFTPAFRDAVESWMGESTTPVTRADKLFSADS